MNEKNTKTQKYFTKDVLENISRMTEGEMKNLLKELEGTPTWTAILRYTQLRMRFVQDTMFSTDPVKEPTTIARAQGMVMGLSDLTDVVINYLSESKKAEDPNQAVEDKKNEAGGAYGKY